MSFSARLLADSLSPAGIRLTTMELTFPRIILAELNTHRALSRNSASSRAIPVEKMLAAVYEDPYIPTSWGQNQKGMQAGAEVSEGDRERAIEAWLNARDMAVANAQQLLDIGIHKQTTNRLLEPFLWHTAIVTATEWSNLFHLRDNKDAHPEIQRIISMAQTLYEVCKPMAVPYGEWHLPLIDDEDRSVIAGWSEGDGQKYQMDMAKISVARCARVSYLTHDGRRDHAEDLKLHDRLLASGHLSPFEHAARPIDFQEEREYMHRPLAGSRPVWSGNFCGWLQYRKTIPFEHDILGAR